MVFLSSQFIYLIRKTGEGKSLVILTTATMLRGVTIVMVPLIGLGSDQVNKSFRVKEGVEAYHIDEDRGEDFMLLSRRLISMKTTEGRSANSVILYCSPQSLSPTGHFSHVLKKLASRNLITSVFVNEAHSIHREGFNGSNFRPEFDAAFSNLLSIVDSQQKKKRCRHVSYTTPGMPRHHRKNKQTKTYCHLLGEDGLAQHFHLCSSVWPTIFGNQA
ncbi:hypothetical protein ACHAXR_006478 [Thalassiosira sp. AJA248-18]